MNTSEIATVTCRDHMTLGFRVSGFRALGFRALGFKGLGFYLGFRV